MSCTCSTAARSAGAKASSLGSPPPTTSGRVQIALQPVEALGEEGGQVVDLILQVGGHFCVGFVCRRRAGGVVALRLVSQR